MGTRITLAQFSQAVARIHEAGVDHERWIDALTAVMGLLEGSRISLMDIEAGSDRLLAIAHLGHDPANGVLRIIHQSPNLFRVLGRDDLQKRVKPLRL